MTEIETLKLANSIYKEQMAVKDQQIANLNKEAFQLMDIIKSLQQQLIQLTERSNK